MAPEAAIELAKEPEKKPNYRYASDPLTLIQREEKLLKQKEKLAKKYKPAMDSFKDQYGKDGESVYYATMTKKAKKGEKA